MPRKKANPDRVAALYTHIGDVLVIRANPSEDAVKGFVAEHSRRYHTGEPGGPSGIPAYHINSAKFFDSESDVYNESVEGEEIDLSEVLPKVVLPNT